MESIGGSTVVHKRRCPSSEHIKHYNGPNASDVRAVSGHGEEKFVEGRDIVLCWSEKWMGSANKVPISVSVDTDCMILPTKVPVFRSGRTGGTCKKGERLRTASRLPPHQTLRGLCRNVQILIYFAREKCFQYSLSRLSRSLEIYG